MKSITKVFLVIATLVAALLAWMLFFNNDGVLETGWNALVTPVNNAWNAITGGTANLLPTFDAAGGAGGYDGTDDLQEVQQEFN